MDADTCYTGKWSNGLPHGSGEITVHAHATDRRVPNHCVSTAKADKTDKYTTCGTSMESKLGGEYPPVWKEGILKNAAKCKCSF